ncbi:ribonuclease P [Nesidiocoris tenuis]|uniref:Ribonuclease P n=1 Tax=Nesidiocoris tenuis TaxID=355587 RepID=A0ABN7BEW1_9HEMI|nr:ribonuclease P [Nesidiocoris tenuis]
MCSQNKDGFSDLNIRQAEYESEFWDVLDRFHVRHVAFNQVVDFGDLDDKKKKKGEKLDDLLPEPVRISVPNNYEGKIAVYNRLTLKFSEVSQWYRMMISQNFKKYHIVSASPQTQHALQHVCSSNEVDLITFEPENKLPWRMSRKLYKMAEERMIFFELPYAPAILDSTCRKNTIQISHTYFTTGKSMNLIVSSGTDKAVYLRSPYDIACLCAVFGLNENIALRTLRQNPLMLVSRAENRRQGKSVIGIMRKLADNSSDSMTSDDQGDETLKTISV